MSLTNPLAPCALALAGVALQAAFVASDLRGAYRRAAVLKALASAAFVALGSLGAWWAASAPAATAPSAAAGPASPPLPGAALAVAGLALGAAGDVLHALRFVPEVKRRAHHLFAAGALSFLLGHLAYLGYLVPRVRAAAGTAGVAPATAAPVLAGLALGGAVALSLSRGVRLRGRRALLGALYLLVLAQFLSFACAWWLLAPGAVTGSLASGAALFLVSDSLLALNTFGRERTGARRAWSLGTYYAAQLLIALSLALPAAA